MRPNQVLMDQRVITVLLLCTLIPCARLDAQTGTPVRSPTPSAAPAQSPEDLDKIKSALEKTPTLILDEQQLRFYVRVYAKQPRFADFIGAFDLKNGPVPRAGMTHQDFLYLVTPKELYASSGGITPLESLQFAITNWAAQAIIKRGLQDIHNARTESEIQAIRARINRELAALAGKS
jgi:hypothetical protein